MEVPILIDGRETGRLRITREGAYTLFEGRSEDPGQVLRLSVYGGGREGRLGVMTPDKGALALRRRLSRSAMTGFPETIEYAGPAGEERKGQAPPGGAAETPRAGTPAAGAGTPPTASGSASAGKAQAPARTSGNAAPRGEPGAGTQLLWYRAGDGSLYTSWAGRQYRAVPMAAHGLPESRIVERRVIEGIEYAVFETKNGRLL